MRRHLEELAHDLIIAKKREEEDDHNFAVGHGQVEGTLFNEQGPNSAAGSLGVNGEEWEHDKDTVARVSPTKWNSGEINPNEEQNEKPTIEHPAANDQSVDDSTPEPPAASLPKTTTVTMEEELNGKSGTQPAGEAATETGTKLQAEPAPDTESSAMSVVALTEQLDGLADTFPSISKATNGILPDSLAQEIASRALPLAEGVTCEAFHALAAEAVWAGFNGTNRVKKPQESVWDCRGGDRWGTAAFFAERIVEREDEAVPGLPRTAAALLVQSDGASGGSGHKHPLSGRAARHAAARGVRLAAVSSRRGFLNQATDVAAQEVHTSVCSGRVCEVQCTTLVAAAS